MVRFRVWIRVRFGIAVRVMIKVRVIGPNYGFGLRSGIELGLGLVSMW